MTEDGARREPGVPQLMSELQVNILQQTHLMQAGEKVKSSLILQQLQSKQQQLMAQLQLAQHALTLNMLLQTREKESREKERDRHRSDTQYSSDGSTKENQNNNNNSLAPSTPALPLASPLLPAKLNGNRHSSSEETEEEGAQSSLLYSGGVCRWPGCERECPSPGTWRSHMTSEHGLSDKTTAQARVQMQIVTQLEVQLKKEKVRLAAMMKHLHPKQSQEELHSPEPKRFRPESPPLSALNTLPKMTVPELLKNSPSLHSLPHYSNPLAHLMSLAPASQSMSPLAALSAESGQAISPTSAIRSSLQDSKSSYNQTLIPDSHRRRVTHHDRGNPNLDPEEDLSKNREFYRVQDVRPPYTYAALIRQVRDTPHPCTVVNVVVRVQSVIAHVNSHNNVSVVEAWKNYELRKKCNNNLQLVNIILSEQVSNN